MTNFIGPRPEYEDHAAGTIRIEIDFEVWANSGRAKHTDLTEQGAWIAQSIQTFFRSQDQGDDTRMHDVRYYGPVKPSEGEVFTYPVQS